MTQDAPMMRCPLPVACLAAFLMVIPRAKPVDPPREWIDKDTGHRVVRLSNEDNQCSFYFHQNAFTENGDKLVFFSPKGLFTYDFQTRSIQQIASGRTGHAIVGKKSRKVYYLQGGTAYETDIDRKATRAILSDARLGTGSGFAINADETRLGGSMITGNCAKELLNPPPAGASSSERGAWMAARLKARVPMALYTIDIKSGKLRTFYTATDWLGHIHFSPTNPRLMMFCHEGPWQEVDRIWTIRTDGGAPEKIHTRMMKHEIAGHEFFSADGRSIYYDLQTPRSKVFWLARHDLETGKLEKFRLKKREWSVHYNVSPDGKVFSGDGGGPNSVARGDNGQFIYLFRPKNGQLESVKLVNLANHNYALEPNAVFTPDGKWLIFRSNLFGGVQIYAVEIAKASAGLR